MLQEITNNTSIIVYHSIIEDFNDQIDPSIVVNPKFFEWQVKYFISYKNVISLEQYIDYVKKGICLTNNSVVITFDDGYKDNFFNVYPILLKYGLPATFFLSTGYIDTGLIKWEDRLSYLITRSKIMEFSLEMDYLPGNIKIFRISREREKARTIRKLVHLLRGVNSYEREQALVQIENQMGLKTLSFLSDNLMLSWEDVREMSRSNGITFGSHGVSHSRLSMLTTEEIKKEIVDSKKQIESKINQEVKYFSFPYGGDDDFNEASKRILKASGFDCAVTNIYGRNNLRSDLFNLKRVTGTNSYGVVFRIGLRIRISAAGEHLKNAINLWRRIY